MTPHLQPHKLSDPDYLRFSRLVSERSGLETPAARRSGLEDAVMQALIESELPDLDVLFGQLTTDGTGVSMLENLIANVTVGETHFYRNRPQFEALEKHILPELIEKRRSVRRLRLWSAGCASGEEPYSLAILVRRLLPDLANWNILILATDINRHSLEKAQRGLYGSWSFREVPPEIHANYFTQTGNRYELIPAIRKMVTFSYLNLVEDNYPSLPTNTQGMDLILCRNVMIYFNEATNRSVVNRLYGSLSNESWLVVGHAEPSQALFHQFTVQNFPGTVIYRKSPGHSALSVFSKQAVSPKEAGPAESFHPSPPSETRPRPALLASTPPPAAKLTNLSLPPSSELQSAVAQFEAGYFKEALAQLETLTAKRPLDFWPPYLLAKIYANRIELDKAEYWIDIALLKESLLAPAHYLRGLILKEAGRIDACLEAFRRCVYADPKFVLGHFALAGEMAHMQQPKRALKTYETVEKLLASQSRDDPIPEGDGITVGRLLEFVSVQKELIRL